VCRCEALSLSLSLSVCVCVRACTRATCTVRHLPLRTTLSTQGLACV
jgi:hypothetical protein